MKGLLILLMAVLLTSHCKSEAPERTPEDAFNETDFSKPGSFVHIIDVENGKVVLSRPYPKGHVWEGHLRGNVLEAVGEHQFYEKLMDSLEVKLLGLPQVHRVEWIIVPESFYATINRRSPGLAYRAFLVSYILGDTATFNESFSPKAREASVAKKLKETMSEYQRVHSAFHQILTDSLSLVTKSGYKISFTKEGEDFKIGSFSKIR